MNHRMIFTVTGKIMLVNAALLLIPALVSVLHREPCTVAFLITAAACGGVGALLSLTARPKSHVIFAREGFFIVSLAWLVMSLFGAMPFVLSGEIPSFADAFFEAASGFSTTGASILRDVERLSRGVLFWRSFTHWIGGMGVLVFVMAFLPKVSERPIHLMRAEMPGPIVGKLSPKAGDTAKILYVIYLALTVLETVLLMAGGMSLYEAAVHAFGTAGTGGFGIRGDSIAGYSPYIQWVITVFMLLFGVNFNLYYLILLGRIRSALKSSELWTYLVMALAAVGVISYSIYPLYRNFKEVLRLSSFQVAAIITTTGYSTADFDRWPSIAKAILFLFMFTGACAGSTAGGFKLSRVMLLFKLIHREIKRMVHPHSVSAVRLEGKTVDEQTLHGAAVYFAIYMICILAVFLLLSLEPFSFETNFSAAVSCFNNIGPGFGSVGPALSYADYSAFSKLVLSAAMLLGRLEIFPLLILFSPAAWRKQ